MEKTKKAPAKAEVKKETWEYKDRIGKTWQENKDTVKTFEHVNLAAIIAVLFSIGTWRYTNLQQTQ